MTVLKVDDYSYEPAAVRQNLARLIGGSFSQRHCFIMAVDQGFEHGPQRSFGDDNAWGWDPRRHLQLASQEKISALTAPLGFLQDIHHTETHVPLILKLNHASALYPKNVAPTLAQVASVRDAVRLGCIGVGWTLYPGSSQFLAQLENLREVIAEARDHGLFTMVWSYPRGEALSKDQEREGDVIAYGAHMACLAGAHIVKVKIPSGDHQTKKNTMKRIVSSCFQGRRWVLFSGGEKATDTSLLEEANLICEVGAHGAVMGRNIFQRSWQDAQSLLRDLLEIYNNRKTAA